MQLMYPKYPHSLQVCVNEYDALPWLIWPWQHLQDPLGQMEACHSSPEWIDRLPRFPLETAAKTHISFFMSCFSLTSQVSVLTLTQPTVCRYKTGSLSFLFWQDLAIFKISDFVLSRVSLLDQNSTCGLQFDSQFHNKFFQCHSTHTPSSPLHHPGILCPLKETTIWNCYISSGVRWWWWWWW